MRETWTFLPGAALAIAVGAISAAALSEQHSSDRVPCDGCGELFAPGELTVGECDSHWCAACAGAGAIYDCVIEDDGEP